MNNRYPRRGRPPKRLDSEELAEIYIYNMSMAEFKQKKRRELTSEISRKNAEVEEQLKQFCLNCEKSSCKHGDCAEWRAQRKKLESESGLKDLYARLRQLYY